MSANLQIALALLTIFLCVYVGVLFTAQGQTTIGAVAFALGAYRAVQLGRALWSRRRRGD